jgi:hypothetical protein
MVGAYGFDDNKDRKEPMRLSIVGAVAIAASLAAIPSMAQAAGCALYDPNCATYPMPKNDVGGGRAAVRADAGEQGASRSAPRSMRVERHAALRDRDYADRYSDRGPAPGAVVGGAVGAAVGTAGAIATAPFRAADSYAYYDEGYGLPQQSYAERNGFVCTPGTYFKGFDGQRHICQ